jgi:hypothetical protein
MTRPHVGPPFIQDQTSPPRQLATMCLDVLQDMGDEGIDGSQHALDRQPEGHQQEDSLGLQPPASGGNGGEKSAAESDQKANGRPNSQKVEPSSRISCPN